MLTPTVTRANARATRRRVAAHALVEGIALVLGVACAAVVGLTALGDGHRAAIEGAGDDEGRGAVGGDGPTRRVAGSALDAHGRLAFAPASVASEAAGFDDLARYAKELATGADGIHGFGAAAQVPVHLTPREAAAAELAARQGGRLRKTFGDVEVSGDVVRVGVPDFAHEASQAMAYARAEGGGVYFFGAERGAPGLDGFFMPWRDPAVHHLRGFDGSPSRFAAESVGVSLKDLSSSRKPWKEFRTDLRRTVRKNAEIVARLSAEPPSGVPEPGAVDLFVSVRQHSAARVVQTLRQNGWWRDVLRASERPSDLGVFRQVLVESADGLVRLTRGTRDGIDHAVVVDTHGFRDTPAWEGHAARLGPP